MTNNVDYHVKWQYGALFLYAIVWVVAYFWLVVLGAKTPIPPFSFNLLAGFVGGSLGGVVSVFIAKSKQQKTIATILRFAIIGIMAGLITIKVAHNLNQFNQLYLMIYASIGGFLGETVILMAVAAFKKWFLKDES